MSFWNLPGGNDNCARFDGTKGWLWSDTNCRLNLNFICQHSEWNKLMKVDAILKLHMPFVAGPLSCGKPEQPPNSTLISAAASGKKNEYRIGSRIEYSCDEGHLLVGPSKRSCLHTGFYSEFPPVCRCKE